MSGEFPYDETQDPPAPVLPLRLSAPGSNSAVLIAALVDSGADCTLVPEAIARQLALPMVDQIEIEGVGGAVRTAPVHAAMVEVGGLRLLARVVAFESEALIGRDLLNRVVMILDGPKRTLSLRRPTRKRR